MLVFLLVGWFFYVFGFFFNPLASHKGETDLCPAKLTAFHCPDPEHQQHRGGPTPTMYIELELANCLRGEGW